MSGRRVSVTIVERHTYFDIRIILILRFRRRLLALCLHYILCVADVLSFPCVYPGKINCLLFIIVEFDDDLKFDNN